MIGSATFGDSRRRRRHQAYGRLVRFALGFVAVAMIGVWGYLVGVASGEARSTLLEADLERLQEDTLTLRDRLALTVQSADRAGRELETLRRRYAEEVPQGVVADLVARIRAQLHDGVAVDRLAFLIDAAGQTPRCEGAPVAKRFAPRTPVTQGPVSAVRFADRIVVSGTGEPSLSADGLAEAWFDPARPVQIEFRTLEGQTSRVEGVLPLDHAMVVDGQEFRFSLIAGRPSFIEIAAQACAFP